MTTLRAVVGEMDLDDVLSKREQINAQLQVKLDEVTVNWGVKVTRVEIKEVEPPRDVQEAMNRQLSAERTRRAAVTEAEGEREAAILRAEGFSLGMERINQAAMQADPRTMSLQYFDTLKDIGGSPSTKFIFPMEFTSMLEPFIQGAQNIASSGADREGG